MPFSRLDPGMATPVDWAPHREAVLEERNQSWPDLPGNQVFLDLVIDGKIEQTMRLVFALFLDEVPLAAANFHALCVQRFDGLGECGKPLCYRQPRRHPHQPPPRAARPGPIGTTSCPCP